jgi:DNA repair protein RadC
MRAIARTKPKAAHHRALYSRFLVRTVLERPAQIDLRLAPKVKSSREVAQLVSVVGLRDQEHMVVVALNYQRRVIAIHEVGIGGTSSVKQWIQHIIKVPVITSASYVYLVHNHPSGRLKPSAADVKFSHRIRRALSCVGIPLLDSIIVSMGRFTSLKQLGLLRAEPKTKK